MLDLDYIRRAAPPGSMRYFALLYASADYRELLSALFAIEFEIRASANASHEVAHTRLQWWRGEIDRLINRNAQHPATMVLQSALPHANYSILHETLSAADMDLARMTYNTSKELDVYLERGGGALFELVANDESRAAARKIGALIRRVETLRDFAADAKAGRIHWPIDELAAHGLTPERLVDDEQQKKLAPLVIAEAKRVAQSLINHKMLEDDLLRRPLSVLAALNTALANQIANSSATSLSARHELGPLRKVFTAWRAARHS